MNDHSVSFEKVRAQLSSSVDESSYREFRKGLTPNYLRSTLDLVLSVGIFALSILIAWYAKHLNFFFVLPSSCFIGICIHRISLFLHEGAHFHLSSSRALNELLTNCTAGLLTLVDVRTYRPGHLAHHRNLGSLDDPERSYQSGLTLKFLIEGFTGIRVLRVLAARRSSSAAIKREESYRLIPILGALVYLMMIFWGSLNSNWTFVVSFVLGFACFFPVIGSTRQLFEHRASRDSFLEDGVPMSRLFKKSLATFFFGAAGFDYHLLHHWDAGIAYTRLPELTEWIRSTSLLSVVEDRESTYTKVFRELWAGAK